MGLRDALNDYKHHRDDDKRFPGERRTTTGRFSGYEGRLVHVHEDGSVRDFSYPLVGLTGVVRSRFGVCPADKRSTETAWFDAPSSAQRYHGDTALVVTDHETPYGTVTQHDLTLDAVHVTHFDTSGANAPLNVVAGVSFAPDGRETRIGQLHHGDTAELYHAKETDYLASHTGFDVLRGSATSDFAELLSETPTVYPRDSRENPSGEDLLGGDIFGVLPVADGTATLATLLTTRAERSRADALDTVRAAASDYDAVTLERTATNQTGPTLPSDHPNADVVAADLRVLSLLAGRSGLRIAGPEFDPHYAYSGGYGYSWFRDDAAISQFLLDVDRQFDLGLGERHDRSATIYAETQLADGTWPHRVWPFDGTLAPGWANGRIETGDASDYQADQTGSVTAYLAAHGAGSDHHDVLTRALDGLDDGLADDGRPVTGENAWEDMSGRFAHTAATFLEAYSVVAATDDALADHAAERATTVYAGMDDLWLEERNMYALREYGADHENTGQLDERCDSAAFALIGAHRAYARIENVDEDRLDRLVSHVTTVIEGLRRDPDSGAVAGLVRYEGDSWRRHGQEEPKIWTVSTAWGAYAAATLAAMLADRDDDRAEGMAATARDLLALVLPDGPLCLDSGYLPEQVFDDGTPDSATPLGWSHALRLATVALMHKQGMLDREPVPADD